jgi:tetratricopeptide (TPR) repeat protein
MFNVIFIGIYQTMFKACCLIPDYTYALNYGRDLLDIYRECGETAEEWSLAITLANMCEQQFKLGEARDLYKRGLNITRENGDRRGQAYAYGKFGHMSYCLGEYDKAKEYLETALAIRIQICDQRGEAEDYGNLGTVFKSLGDYDKAKEYLQKALAIRIQIRDPESAYHQNTNC